MSSERQRDRWLLARIRPTSWFFLSMSRQGHWRALSFFRQIVQPGAGNAEIGQGFYGFNISGFCQNM